ncbi:MAG TPA: lysophospholipid acyltransferase family protein [Longimicrobiaceae bacterium]
MIRTLWVYTVIAGATVFYGTRAIAASLRGVRGDLYVRVTQGWARAIVRAAGVRIETRGLENVRPEAQVIVSNHVSWFDIFALASVLPVPFHFVAKKELERIPLFGAAWKAAGHVSIDRSNRQLALESLRRAGEQIRRERSAVIIYPEGTRSRTGRLQPFKKGAFMLAVEAGVPVVPTVMVGSYDVMRPDSWRIRPRPVQIHFAEPIPTDGYGGSSGEALMERVYGVVRGVLEREESLPPLEG